MRAEEEAKAKKVKEREKEGGGESADDEGESTEVKTEQAAGLEGSRGSLSLSGFEEGAVRSGSDLKGEQEEGAVRQRNTKTQEAQGARSGDLSGDISTDSEWEKVEGGR